MVTKMFILAWSQNMPVKQHMPFLKDKERAVTIIAAEMWRVCHQAMGLHWIDDQIKQPDRMHRAPAFVVKGNAFRGKGEAKHVACDALMAGAIGERAVFMQANHRAGGILLRSCRAFAIT